MAFRLKTFLVLVAAVVALPVMAAVESRFNNWRGAPILISDGAGDSWWLPAGFSRVDLPVGTYAVKTTDAMDGEVLALSGSAFDVHVWSTTNNPSSLAVYSESASSPFVWFGEGFGLGLLFFGFALVLRSVRSIGTHVE